ncbi:asparaginase [Tropicimonas isoalkanivorans]|uniref:Asparaginase n=1 Tax=Tropicimonas isoalkanivorans TaxID=441112 RepID=A0A1I1P6N8_9RHOB|nr:asparaginase [Tropicimonas isoalkanivorans]SFD02653.1 asparaginase [Tropicimonas isoalkanivorans]
MSAVEMVELWRGDIRESVHRGHAVVCDETGAVVHAWGEPQKVVLPRSSAKVVQALPLLESGAADAARLTPEQLALACASHSGAQIHISRVERWLSDLGLGEDDLRCGPQEPSDPEEHERLLCTDGVPCQLHNNCSGKHAGFLTLSQHLGAGPDYVDLDHPVQQAVRASWEEVTGETSPGFGIDGCSAPNFAATLAGVGRAMARFAAAREGMGRRQAGQERLVRAMMAHPALVAGEGRACTELMRVMDGAGVVKTGAEGFYVAILPERRLGVALKIEDGTTRASECAIAAILVSLGVLDRAHPYVRRYLDPHLLNRRGMDTGQMRPVPGVFD